MPLVVKCFPDDIRIAAVSGRSIAERARMVARQIREGYDLASDIYLGPEYLFAHDIALLPGRCRPITFQEAAEAKSIIAEASRYAVGMLVVPGTFFFSTAGANPRVFNTAYAYVNGIEVAAVSKSGHAGDAQYASDNGLTFVPMADQDASVVFPWAGQQVCLQICADITLNPRAPCNLGLHPAFMPGAVMAAASSQPNAPARRVILDGCTGRPRALPTASSTVVPGVAMLS